MPSYGVCTMSTMKDTNKRRYCIQLDQVLRERLEEAAERNGRSLAGEVRFALNYYVAVDEENA